jgi:hypothetical protein
MDLRYDLRMEERDEYYCCGQNALPEEICAEKAD